MSANTTTTATISHARRPLNWQKVMLSSVQSAILQTPSDPRLANTMTRRAIARVHIIPSST